MSGKVVVCPEQEDRRKQLAAKCPIVPAIIMARATAAHTLTAGKETVTPESSPSVTLVGKADAGATSPARSLAVIVPPTPLASATLTICVAGQERTPLFRSGAKQVKAKAGVGLKTDMSFSAVAGSALQSIVTSCSKCLDAPFIRGRACTTRTVCDMITVLKTWSFGLNLSLLASASATFWRGLGRLLTATGEGTGNTGWTAK